MRWWVRNIRQRWWLPAVLLVATAPVCPAVGASLPVDCFPDAVTVWQAAPPDPELRFGAGKLPGIVLGPPGSSTAVTGSTAVASLGNGGSVVVAFLDIIIEDRPGPDFIIFENPFFVGAPPAGSGDDYLVFAEPALVQVSVDGQQWLTFPHDQAALAESSGTPVDRDLLARLQGLAGITPTFTGNWTVPEDPLVWDTSGTGGVSGAGGDAFDLAAVGVTEARFVRLIDAGTMNGASGAAEGFDLDSVVVLHGRPLPTIGLDSDGDRLGDLAETLLYGTLPGDADTDADGVDDGREVAGCRDPDDSGDQPRPFLEPALHLLDSACTDLRWTFMGSGATYDLIRGQLSNLRLLGDIVDLGQTTCLGAAHTLTTWSCDSETPAPAEGFFYLVRDDRGGYGWSSSLQERQELTGCP